MDIGIHCDYTLHWFNPFNSSKCYSFLHLLDNLLKEIFWSYGARIDDNLQYFFNNAGGILRILLVCALYCPRCWRNSLGTVAIFQMIFVRLFEEAQPYYSWMYGELSTPSLFRDIFDDCRKNKTTNQTCLIIKNVFGARVRVEDAIWAAWSAAHFVRNCRAK